MNLLHCKDKSNYNNTLDEIPIKMRFLKDTVRINSILRLSQYKKSFIFSFLFFVTVVIFKMEEEVYVRNETLDFAE